MTDRMFSPLCVHAGRVAADRTAAHHQMVGVADQIFAVGEWHRAGFMAPWAPETAADWTATRNSR